MGLDIKKKDKKLTLSKDDKQQPKEKKSLLNMDIKDIKKYFSKKKNSQAVSASRDKKKSVVAFDIGTTTIKMVQGMYYKGKLTIDTCVKIKTPSNSIEEGEIKNRDAISTMIGAAVRQYNIRAKDAICTTNPTSIINREISVPKVEPDELETVVRYEIQQYLPINLDDCILQMTVLGEVEDEFDGKTKLNVRVIAYPKRVALEYYRLLSDLNLRPYALDVNFNAINKLVNITEMNKTENDVNGSIALLDMGANFIDVNIYKGENLDFTRRIKAGGKDVDESLIFNGAFTEENVTHAKFNEVDLTDTSGVKLETKITEEVVNEWIEKIEMILQFYRNKDVGNHIEKIFIFGGSSRFKGLAEYISGKIGIPVASINNISHVAFKRAEFNGPMLSDYINAIGSVIRL
ncbi:pilus assembly protein PilM [uncultured Clostridium sp.]|uniref:pilus assembly protein PilM n=1 Tax=uncultured Clostridium sp. TaxID=59620 RepID=UPI0025DEF645|nr:pilus assembly protein PilM [uncultured Clostridium sp.]